MGWTNPKTWGVAETVDDATMNLHVRDNLLYLKNAVENPTVEKIFFNAVADPGTDYTLWRNTANSWLYYTAPADRGLLIDGGGRLQVRADITLVNSTPPVAGATASRIWHDSIESELYMFNSSELIQRRPHDNRPTSCSHFDDFICTAQANPAAGAAYGFGDHSSASFATNTNALLVQWQGDTNRPGAVYWNIGTATNGNYSSLNSNRVQFPLKLAHGLKRFGIGFRSGSDPGPQYNDHWCGVGNNASTRPSSFIGFESLTGELNWWAVTSNGGSRTRTDTGIAVGANTWADLEVDTSNSSSVKFYINNMLKATHTINAPTALLQMIVSNTYRASGSATGNVVVDYWYWDLAPARSY